MHLFRNHYRTEGGISAGFSWHTSRLEALEAAQKRDSRCDDPCDKCDTKAEKIVVQPGRDALARFLNRYASHADNG